jgi:hypothetical protein
MEIPHGAQGINATVFDRHRSSGASFIRNGVHAVVFKDPKGLSGFFVETMDPFPLLRFRDSVHHVDSPCSNGRPTVARADGGTPLNLEFRIGEPFDETVLVPGAIPLRSAPLGPVIGRGNVGKLRN